MDNGPFNAVSQPLPGKMPLDILRPSDLHLGVGLRPRETGSFVGSHQDDLRIWIKYGNDVLWSHSFAATNYGVERRGDSGESEDSHISMYCWKSSPCAQILFRIRSTSTWLLTRNNKSNGPDSKRGYGEHWKTSWNGTNFRGNYFKIKKKVPFTETNFSF